MSTTGRPSDGEHEEERVSSNPDPQFRRGTLGSLGTRAAAVAPTLRFFQSSEVQGTNEHLQPQEQTPLEMGTNKILQFTRDK